ncbi:MAG: alpha/beta hydrolase, partial [Clostridia bacterium]|nr:alpha/beta hydrolase [Clostridia bacterium]
LALIAIIKLFRGKKHFSPLIHKLSTGGYNDKFDDDAEGLKNAWLTTDMEVRRRNASDPLCKFKFSVSAMGDLIRLLKYSNRSAWYKKLPKNMPILLVSGKDDPVGDFGRGVEKVYGRMQKNGLNATLRLYEGARHEILNDFTYEQTKNDILDFTEDTL